MDYVKIILLYDRVSGQVNWVRSNTLHGIFWEKILKECTLCIFRIVYFMFKVKGVTIVLQLSQSSNNVNRRVGRPIDSHTNSGQFRYVQQYALHVTQQCLPSLTPCAHRQQDTAIQPGQYPVKSVCGVLSVI